MLRNNNFPAWKVDIINKKGCGITDRRSVFYRIEPTSLIAGESTFFLNNFDPKTSLKNVLNYKITQRHMYLRPYLLKKIKSQQFYQSIGAAFTHFRMINDITI